MDARSRFQELLLKVEAFGARVTQRHPGALACAAELGAPAGRRFEIAAVLAGG